jgi:hypothetical protein
MVSGVLALATLIAGLAGIYGRSTEFRAEARVLIAPTPGPTDLSVQASDTLSRGTVVATFSEAYQGGEVVNAAFDKAGIPSSDAQRVSMSTQVLAGTSIIRVIANSREPLLAERGADAVAHYRPQLGGYSKGFEPKLLTAAAGTATRSGASSTVLVLIALGAAVLAFLVSAAVLRRIPASFAAPAPRHDEVAPGPEPIADSAQAEMPTASAGTRR